MAAIGLLQNGLIPCPNAYNFMSKAMDLFRTRPERAPTFGYACA